MENLPSHMKLEAQQQSIEFHATISFGSMLYFIRRLQVLVMFFHTPVLNLLAKTDQCLPSNLWIHRMTFDHMEESSDFKRHIHLANEEISRALIDPSLMPPTIFGAIILSHFTQHILFLSYSLHQMNFLLIFSRVSITPFGATNMDIKYVGRLPCTAFASVTLPPKLSNFALYEDSLEWNFSIIGLHAFFYSYSPL